MKESLDIWREAADIYRVGIAYRKLEDDVPQATKMARLHAIEQLEAEISARINSRFLGQQVEVLVEGKKPRPEPVEGPNAEGKPALFGRTRGNKLVHFAGDARPGDLATVRIDRTSPWSLVGTAKTPVTA